MRERERVTETETEREWASIFFNEYVLIPPLLRGWHFRAL